MRKIKLNIEISFELYKKVCESCERLNITIDEFVEKALEKEIDRIKGLNKL